MLMIRKISLLLLLGIFMGVVPAAAQSGSRLGSGLLTDQVLKKHGLERAWWAQAVMNYQKDELRHLTNDEQNVYVQCSNNIITAFDAESGRKKWATRVGNANSPSSPASTNDKYVFLTSKATLYMLDKEDGKILHELPLPGQPSTQVSVDEETCYLGFLDGSVYAYDIKTGDMKWRYKTSKRVLVPPMPNGTTVLFASTNGVLFAINSLTRDNIFLFEADNALTAPMAQYEDKVLLASEDFKLYAVNINNGSQGWKDPFLSGDKIRKAPVVIGDNVYLTPEHSGLFRINADTGVEYWFRNGIEKLVAVNPQHVYGVDRLNHLVKMNRDTGGVISGLQLGPLTVRMTNQRTDRIYLATEEGLVICLREIERDLPHYHQNPQEQPILPQFAPEQPESAKAAQ